jgi:membrane associated rhomboid family serine protease
MFLAELAVTRFFPAYRHIFGYLALSKEGLEHGYVWQLMTYQFMHAGWLHILLNSWVIYVFGREMESVLGGRKFLTLMFSSGMVGGVFQMLVALVWPQYFGGAVVGASACGFGLIAAYALMFPERELTMLIFFVIPVHMRAKTLLIALVVLAVAGIAFPMDNVANAAHLGGMAMGWFFVRKILQGDWSRLAGAMRPAEKRVGKSAPRVPVEPPEEKPEGSFMESEVDPILDKISAHGIQSLTARERAILEAARKQVRRP